MPRHVPIGLDSLIFLLSAIAIPRRASLTMHLDEETQAAKSSLALKDKLQPLEAELVRIEATAYEVKLEAEHGREREATHRDQSGSFRSRSIPDKCSFLMSLWHF